MGKHSKQPKNEGKMNSWCSAVTTVETKQGTHPLHCHPCAQPVHGGPTARIS